MSLVIRMSAHVNKPNIDSYQEQQASQLASHLGKA